MVDQLNARARGAKYINARSAVTSNILRSLRKSRYISAKRKIFDTSDRLKKNTTTFLNTEKRVENTTRSRVSLT